MNCPARILLLHVTWWFNFLTPLGFPSSLSFMVKAYPFLCFYRTSSSFFWSPGQSACTYSACDDGYFDLAFAFPREWLLNEIEIGAILLEQLIEQIFLLLRPTLRLVALWWFRVKLVAVFEWARFALMIIFPNVLFLLERYLINQLTDCSLLFLSQNCLILDLNQLIKMDALIRLIRVTDNLFARIKHTIITFRFR